MRPCPRMMLFVLLLVCPTLFAEGQHGAPPAPPLLEQFAARGQMVRSGRWVRASQAAKSASSQQTDVLTLSAGVTLISIPLRTDSQLLSDLLPNLPDGSRVWTWDAFNQQFVEGFDQQLPLGHGALLYVPVPTIVTVTGTMDASTDIPVELENGWNLVGVPYDVTLPRSAQTVYAAGVAQRFNDAMTQGDLQEPVYTSDENGYREIGADDSFEPMNAYWLFSKDAEMVELQPPIVGEINPVAKWTLEKIGTVGLNYVIGTYLPGLSPNPTKAVLDQLATISSQLTQIQTTQDALVDRTAQLERLVGADGAETRTNIGEAPIKAVEAALAVNYDGSSPFRSFTWFQNAVKKAQQNNPDLTDVNSITDQKKFDFANNVINVWNYEKQFESIRLAVLPSTGKGVLENYAATVILGNSKGTLEDRYRAFDEYFNWILGVQTKSMILITNAYNELARNPLVSPSDRAVYAGFADQWRTGTYANVVAQEVKRFRAAMESVLVGTLEIRTKAGEPAVRVPAAIQDVAMPQTDLMAMELLQEAPGVRLRVLVTPDMNPANTYKVVSFTWGYLADLPSTDSGLWQRMSVNGAPPYDSWQIDPPTSNPKVFAQKDWLLWRSGPVDQPAANLDFTQRFLIGDAWKLADQTYYNDFKVAVINDPNRPSINGKRFASRTLVLRATANTMLTVRDGRATGNSCRPSVFMNMTNDEFLVQNCRGDVSITKQVPFIFGGGSPSLGNWQMNMEYHKEGWTITGKSYAYVRLNGPGGIVSDLNVNSTGEYSRTTPNIQWQAGQTYNFEMTMYNDENIYKCTSEEYCVSCIQRGNCPLATTSAIRGPLVMTFR